MTIGFGAIRPFAVYLEGSRPARRAPVVWRWSDVSAAIAQSPHGERGTVALEDPGNQYDCSIVQDVSLTVQVVPPDTMTSTHEHSFWHLFVVQSGKGVAIAEPDEVGQPLFPGDVVFVPAWCPHRLGSRSREQPLVLLVVQNLPQMARLGSLARRDNGGSIVVVHEGTPCQTIAWRDENG